MPDDVSDVIELEVAQPLAQMRLPPRMIRHPRQKWIPKVVGVEEHTDRSVISDTLVRYVESSLDERLAQPRRSAAPGSDDQQILREAPTVLELLDAVHLRSTAGRRVLALEPS